jgi:hypothetical protein
MREKVFGRLASSLGGQRKGKYRSSTQTLATITSRIISECLKNGSHAWYCSHRRIRFMEIYKLPVRAEFPPVSLLKKKKKKKPE